MITPVRFARVGRAGRRGRLRTKPAI